MMVINSLFSSRIFLQGTYVPWSKLSRFFGDKLIPPLMTESLEWIYKPLRTWVDDHPLLYGNNGSLDPGTYTWRIGTHDERFSG